MKPWCLFLAAATLLAQDATFKVDTKLVILSVSVKDRRGSPISNLTKPDFQIFEDGVPQTISVFDLHMPGSKPFLTRTPSDRKLPPGKTDDSPPTNSIRAQWPRDRYWLQNRRLLVLFFDLASMKPAEQARAQRAATSFVETGITSSDLISIMTFSNKLHMIEDFTDDRPSLIESLRRMRSDEMSSLETSFQSKTGGSDSGFFSEETEFNIFNTDRKLVALENAARALGVHQEKKALIFFSSGVEKTGVENLSQLKATVNTARRSNVSFYPIDARGLVAIPPGGDASTPSSSDTGILTGAQQQGVRDGLNASQETLYALAADTGGRAFLDSNDLTLGMRQAQEDVTTYYSIGYYSTKSAEDGTYRSLRVLLKNGLQARLDYRPGYYASKTFETFSDKQRPLELALALGNVTNDFSLALETDYFRVGKDRYFVPISVRIPRSAVRLSNEGSEQTAHLDFLCQVRNLAGRLVGGVQDKIKVAVADTRADQMRQRNLQYDTGLTLSSGSYHLIFLVRERQTGKMGRFETTFLVPDLNSQQSLRVSSVIISSQIEPLSSAVGGADNNKKLIELHPLVQDGKKMIPSITRVFRRDQVLYVYFEVYDPNTDPESGEPSLSAELDLLSGGRMAMTSRPVRIDRLSTSRPGVVQFNFQMPLDGVQPGECIAQVNVVDELGRSFTFLRNRILLIP